MSWTGTALKAQIDKLNEAMPNELKDVRDAINKMQKEVGCTIFLMHSHTAFSLNAVEERLQAIG